MAGPCEDVSVLVVLVAGKGPGGGSVVAVVPRALRCEVWGMSLYWVPVCACNFVLVSCHIVLSHLDCWCLPLFPEVWWGPLNCWWGLPWGRLCCLLLSASRGFCCPSGCVPCCSAVSLLSVEYCCSVLLYGRSLLSSGVSSGLYVLVYRELLWGVLVSIVK